MKRGAGLNFDPKAQLQHILEDYPGGQLLSEALQNAEDGGASEFALLLDMREHDVAESALSGPAFMLIDNGTGFGDREWRSLRAVHRSEKRSNPKEIGCFGMGSRSYFHYADIIAVVSRGKYVGIDPLDVTARDGGWEADLTAAAADDSLVEARRLFAPATHIDAAHGELCEGFDDLSRGAAFRLPLRRAEDVEREQQSGTGLLGPQISPAQADALMAEWAAAAPRLLLFLSSVEKVALWRWRADGALPELMAKARKEYVSGGPHVRMPTQLPASATRSYAELRQHLLALDASARAALSAAHTARVRITLSRPAAPPPQQAEEQEQEQKQEQEQEQEQAEEQAEWLVAQRFDAASEAVLEALRGEAGCDAVPHVGVAMPLGGGAIEGRPFCFLPIGNMRTGMPVHINGSFSPTPNRRELWLPAADLTGVHVKYARWNAVLIRHAVPQLWLEALEALQRLAPAEAQQPQGGGQGGGQGAAQSGDGGEAAAVDAAARLLSMLPDLDAVSPAWRPCAEQLYARLGGRLLLPHTQGGRREWVAPNTALALAPPTAALGAHAERLMALHARCPPAKLAAQLRALGSAQHVVALPAHVQRGCARFSGLTEAALERVLACVVRADLAAFEAAQGEAGLLAMGLKELKQLADHAQLQLPRGVDKGELVALLLAQTNVGRVDGVLRPLLLALLAHAAGFAAEEHREWRALLARVPWVRTAAGEAVVLSAAFAPTAHLEQWRLRAATRGRAVEMEAALVPAAQQWGLKPELSWLDCVEEARAIAEEGDAPLEEKAAWATRLLDYIAQHRAQISAASPAGSAEPCHAQLRALAFHPAIEPCRPALVTAAVPRGNLCLRAPSALLPAQHAALVWAVAAYAAHSAPFLAYAELHAPILIEQIVALARLGQEQGSRGGDPAALALHLLEAATALNQRAPAELSGALDGEQLAGLRAASWVAGLGGDAAELRLFPPSRVAHKLQLDLWPRFGRLPDAWSTSLRGGSLAAAVGVRHQLSSAVLAAELRAIYTEHRAAPALEQGLLLLCTRLATELARTLPTPLDGGTAPVAVAGEELVVPTSSMRLLPSSQVFIDDAPWHSSDAPAQALLHAAISAEDGRALGCTSVRDELARLCEVEQEAQLGEEFAQSEPLWKRIEGLLAKYNDQKDLFVEHYQNCDDAGADKVLFLLDSATYDATSCVSAEAAELQGPALVLASSRPLSNDDLRRMRRLGDSQKRADFAKAGRFGLGLNSLYHLSDFLQIFAEDLALVILDPLARAGGGKRYVPAQLAHKFPCMLEPFAALRAQYPGYPTIFRLPLRRTGSPFGKRWDVHAVKALMDHFLEQQATELLLFAKTVRQVNFGVRAENGTAQTLRQLSRTITGHETDPETEEGPPRRKQQKEEAFMTRLPATADAVLGLQAAPRDRLEKVTISTYSAGNRGREDAVWLVSHSLALDAEGAQLMRAALGGSTPTALMPHAAVALRLNAPDTYAGNVAAYMPIGMAVGAPVVLHACFALDESRKVIQLPDGKKRLNAQLAQWNRGLLYGACARALCALALRCRAMVDAGEMPLDALLRLLALEDLPSQANAASKPLRDALRRGVWQRLLVEGSALLPAASLGGEVRWWLPICEATHLRAEGLDGDVQDALLADGLRLAWLPAVLCDALREAARELGIASPQPLSPRALCRFLKEAQRRASPAQLGALRTRPFTRALLRFVLPTPDKAGGGATFTFGAAPPRPPPIDLALLSGVPLLRLADDSLAEFGEGCARFWPGEIDVALLPHARQLLLHEKTAVDLRTASRSLQRVEQACERQLGIRHLRVADLLEHKESIHGLILHQEASDDGGGGGGGASAWLSAFWAFVKKEIGDPRRAGVFHDRSSLMRHFADWSVLQVEGHADPQQVRTVVLSSAAAAFNVHEVDKDWQAEVRSLLQACRVHVPCRWHVAAADAPLRRFVLEGDLALVRLLAAAMERVDFSAYMRQTTLRYFASRKQNSPDVLSTLRKMPLFLRSRPSQSDRHIQSSGEPSKASKYVRLDQPDMVYLSLCDTRHLKLRHAGQLQLLELEGLCFVADGGGELRQLYAQLGVTTQDTLSFVTEQLPQKLLRVLSDGDEREADKVLAEVTSWVVDEADDARKMVIDAFKPVAFVPCDDGERRVATALVDRELPVTTVFASGLRSCLPEPRFAMAHRKLLAALGLRSYLPSSELLKCATSLAEVEVADGEPLPHDLLAQSFRLVEALSSSLLYTLNRTDETKRKPSAALLAALQQRILLATEPPTHEQAVSRVGRLAAAQDPATQPIKLLRFSQVLLPRCDGSLLDPPSSRTAKCGCMSVYTAGCVRAGLAWTVLPLSAHDAALPAVLGDASADYGQTKLRQLARKHAADLEGLVGVYSTCVPLELQAQHLLKLTAAANEPHGLRGLYPRHSPLDEEISEVLKVMDAAVKVMDAAVGSDERAPSWQILRPHSAQACLPHVLTSDRASALASDAAEPVAEDTIGRRHAPNVRLVAPSQVFWKLEAEQATQPLLLSASRPLLLRRDLATALGVRERPSLADWAACTRAVRDRYEQDDSGAERLLLPEDVAVIEAAVHGIAKVAAAGEAPAPAGFYPRGASAASPGVLTSGVATVEPAEIFLIDDASEEEGRALHSSSSLLYADLPALKPRCAALLHHRNLRFVNTELVREHGEKLVRLTSLRTLSSLVGEWVPADIVPLDAEAVNNFDRQLAGLIESEDFAQGCVALACGGLVVARWAQEVKQRLDGLTVQWAAGLESVLKLVDDDSEVEGSRAESCAFVEQQTLWLHAGLLGGETEPTFLRRTAECLASVLSGVGPISRTTLQTSQLLSLLECWHRGPRAVEGKLAEMNVRDTTSRLTHFPGELVDPRFHRYFDNSLNCVFAYDELVAVESEFAGGRCMFAQFRGEAPQQGDEGGAASSSDHEPALLRRRYALWCGDKDGDTERLTTHTHLSVYKITRQKAQALQLPAPAQAAATLAERASAGPGAAEAAGLVESGDDFGQLRATLLEMLRMPDAECKRAARRLYKTWHPDKCNKPHAARFFRIAQRFAGLCQQDRDAAEAFIASLVDETDASQGYDEVEQHTWFAEFHNEQQQQQRQQQQQQQPAGAGGSGGAGPSAGRAGDVFGPSYAGGMRHEGTKRLRHPVLGDVEWQSAQNELQVARILQDAQQWASAAFHAQQAAEHVIKAAMLRTCGVIKDEFRGAAGHALCALMEQTGLRSPVPSAELERLSKAYLHTRYAPFPPQGVPTAPFTNYSAGEAAEALTCAAALVEWGRSTEQVEPSLTPRSQ